MYRSLQNPEATQLYRPETAYCPVVLQPPGHSPSTHPVHRQYDVHDGNFNDLGENEYYSRSFSYLIIINAGEPAAGPGLDLDAGPFRRRKVLEF